MDRIPLSGLYLEMVNRVLWRTLSGRAIEDPTKMARLKYGIREIFRNLERGSLLILLQVMGNFS